VSLLNELKRRNVIRVAAGYIVVAWLVVQVVETIFPAFGFGDEAIRFVVIGFSVAFIPVVVLAWVFEWTPEGIKKDEGAEQRGPSVAIAAKRWDRVVMLILAIAVSYFVVDKIITSRQAGPSIAVLPFASMSPDPEQAFFGAGVADEVLSLLAKIPQLYVTSRTSSFTYAEQGLSVAEIADKLDVDHILEGSVRQAGDKIRVTAQLIDTKTDRNLWSQTWDRPMADIFEIQDEIVVEIVGKLSVVLDGPVPTSRRTDPVVVALVLKARQIFYDNYGSPQKGTAERMWSLLEQALEIDPEYAPAIAWLGYADWFAQTEGLIDDETAKRRFAEQSERVLTIDPEQSNMLQQLAWTALNVDVDLEEAADLIQRAVRSGPNDPEVLRGAGRFAYVIGRYDESRELLERAIRIDPLCTTCLYHASRLYMRTGDLARAEDVRLRYQSLGYGGGQYFLGITRLMQGDAEGAANAFEELPVGGRNSQYRQAGMAMVFHALGEVEQSDLLVRSLADEYGSTEPDLLAEVEAWRGNVDAAFEWLDRYLAKPESLIGAETGTYGGAKNYVGRPTFRNLHDDPRWAEFRERVGMSPERLAALDVDLTIPE